MQLGGATAYYFFSYESVCPVTAGFLSFFVLQTKQHLFWAALIN
jgi:hypothetical protein